MKVDRELLDLNHEEYRSVPSQEQKVFYPLSAVHDSFPVDRLYILNWGEQFGISEITGSQKLNVLLQHVFRNEYLGAFAQNQSLFFDQFVRFIGSIPMFHITKTKSMTRTETFNLLLKHVQDC
jgi:hypothetical protein